VLNTVKAGVVSADVSFSHDGGSTPHSGRAVAFGHTFLSGPFSSQIVLQRYSENYSVIGFTSTANPKLQASASLNYGTRDAGTYSLTYAVNTVYGGFDDEHATTLGYTKTLVKNVSLVVNASRVLQGPPGYALFFGLSFFGPNGQSANVSRQKSNLGDNSTQLQVAKAPPIGEGLGYRVVAERAETSGVASESISPFVQYNTRNTILTAQGTSFVNGGASPGNFYQLSLAGAVAYIGGGAYLSRPITDSFGLARIEPPLAGVRVLKSGADIGTTDAGGTVFVPNLGSYQVNEVAIQPKDVPLDYTIAQTLQKFRPPFRAGVIALFPVTRVRAVSGSLKLRSNGVLTPIENRDVVLAGGAEPALLSTIRNGDFYLENLMPGRYTAQLKVGDKTCSLALTVPDTQDIVANLGDVICEIAR
jgi:outer membrane usher protein